MGVGTLIIFIAILIVAAVAAGSFIQVSSSLQQNALKTGSQVRLQLTSSVFVLNVNGQNGNTGALENFTVLARITTGSDPINLSTLLIRLQLTNASVEYHFSGNASYTVNASNQNGTFGIEYPQTGANYKYGALAKGDLVEFTFQSPRKIVRDEDVALRFNPSSGMTTTTKFSLPSVITMKVVTLYP